MKNIIWLFIDSLSQLLINKEDSPFLWKEFGKSLWFTQCVTTTPYTGASYYSQITGRYAQHHGYNSYHIPRNLPRDRVYSDQSDIINRFKEKGYHTVLHSPDGPVAPHLRAKMVDKNEKSHVRNLLGGFAETHNISLSPSKDEFENVTRPDIEPLFWFYHFASFLRGLKGYHKRERIRKCLRDVDERIREFIEGHTREDDIVIYTSDHGFGTRGREFGTPPERHHGVTLMECCIRIPFVIRGVGPSGQVSKMVRGVDVGPTVLGLIDEELDDTDGVNLLPFVKAGRMPDLEAIIETGPHETARFYHTRFGIRDNNFKYVFVCDGRHIPECLYSSSRMEPIGDVVDDDGVIVENHELLCGYREKVLAYLEQYDLKKQRARLLELKESGLKEY